MKQKSSLSSPYAAKPDLLWENYEDPESTFPLLLSTLSAKERDALERACSGADYPEVAAKLGINRWSFKSRVERAKAKIGVNTRLQAITLLKAHEISERILIPQTAERFGLFPREMDVLTLICRGMNRPAIAQELVVGENTVRIHIKHLCEKVGARNCVEIIAFLLAPGEVLSPRSKGTHHKKIHEREKYGHSSCMAAQSNHPPSERY